MLVLGLVLVLVLVLLAFVVEGRPPPGPCPTLILTANPRRCWQCPSTRISNFVSSGDRAREDDDAEDEGQLLRLQRPQDVPGCKIRRRPALCR